MTHSGCMSSETKFLRLSNLRNLRETEQVAAVCYRMRGAAIEFLLVQTGGGRWIFPKGSAEPGLTHAQAAAIEAFEEAGVHGSIEKRSFSRYRVCRPGKRNSGKQTVMAHLCEVLRLSPPQESGRNRTWFTVEKSKRRLREDRSAEEGNELARVVSRAVIRIRQSRENTVSTPKVALMQYKTKDSLQKVQFETSAIGQPQGQIDALYMRYIRRLPGDAQRWADSDLPGILTEPLPRLGSGNITAAAIQKVTTIDQGRSYRGKARS
jgi:8-oxo-dGTP pyrophosphatase MutT (NUDIX family)